MRRLSELKKYLVAAAVAGMRSGYQLGQSPALWHHTLG